MTTDFTEPTPNLPLLRKVLDHIDAHPEEWKQSEWALKYPQSQVQDPSTAACGTSFCIAGHTVAMAGGQVQWKRRFPWTKDDQTQDASRVVMPGGVEEEKIRDVAQRELGLTDNEAEFLFYGFNTRPDVQQIAEQIAARAGEVL